EILDRRILEKERVRGGGVRTAALAEPPERIELELLLTGIAKVRAFEHAEQMLAIDLGAFLIAAVCLGGRCRRPVARERGTVRLAKTQQQHGHSRREP